MKQTLSLSFSYFCYLFCRPLLSAFYFQILLLFSISYYSLPIEAIIYLLTQVSYEASYIATWVEIQIAFKSQIMKRLIIIILSVSRLVRNRHNYKGILDFIHLELPFKILPTSKRLPECVESNWRLQYLYQYSARIWDSDAYLVPSKNIRILSQIHAMTPFSLFYWAVPFSFHRFCTVVVLIQNHRIFKVGPIIFFQLINISYVHSAISFFLYLPDVL